MCVALCALAAVTVFGGGALSRWQDFQGARAQVETGTFYPGITVDGVDVSGMTLDQALAAWEEKAQQSYQIANRAEIDGETWLLTPEEMGYRADYQQVLTSAYSQGRYGTFAQRQAQVEKRLGPSCNHVTYTVTTRRCWSGCLRSPPKCPSLRWRPPFPGLARRAALPSPRGRTGW